MNDMRKRDFWLAVAGLFFSLSTLLCCALPALLVALGMGAVVAGLVSNIPALIWLSEHKKAIFLLAGILLVVSGFARFKDAKKATCPVDPIKARACIMLKKISFVMFWLAVIFYAIGLFFTFFAAKLFS